MLWEAWCNDSAGVYVGHQAPAAVKSRLNSSSEIVAPPPDANDLILPARKQRIAMTMSAPAAAGHGRPRPHRSRSQHGAQNDDPLPDDADAPGPNARLLASSCQPRSPSGESDQSAD